MSQKLSEILTLKSLEWFSMFKGRVPWCSRRWTINYLNFRRILGNSLPEKINKQTNTKRFIVTVRRINFWRNHKFRETDAANIYEIISRVDLDQKNSDQIYKIFSYLPKFANFIPILLISNRLKLINNYIIKIAKYKNTKYKKI